VPPISLTQFVDFVIVAGSPKVTKVREIKYQGDYNPATDFWRALRDSLREQPNGETLSDLLVEITDPKKVKRYPGAISGYKKFVGRTERQWFIPRPENWTYAGLEVRVNPEIGFVQDGERYIVKLYFKDDEPTKRRLEVVFEMMRETLSGEPGSRMAVLDVSKGRLIKANAQSARIGPLLRGEALNFMEIWNSV
jgi:hypothetical protein